MLNANKVNISYDVVIGAWLYLNALNTKYTTWLITIRIRSGLLNLIKSAALFSILLKKENPYIRITIP
jgi:hypothetical protein